MRMKSIWNVSVAVLAAAVLTMGSWGQAHAVTISLDDPTTVGVDVILADGAVGDANAAAGAVTYSGAIGGTVWTVNVTTAVTYPALGTPALAILDLNSINVSGGGAGSLTIMASEVGYTGPIVGGSASFAHNVGGTTIGTASFSAFLDPANVLFATALPLGALGPFGPGAFSGSIAGSAATGSPFSLTLVASITHPGAGTTSFDDELTSVPEPATLLLLGSGLVGMGWFGRKRMKKDDDPKA